MTEPSKAPIEVAIADGLHDLRAVLAERTQRDPRIDKFLLAVAGFVAIGFFSWAGVVWQAQGNIVGQQHDIVVRLTAMSSTQATVLRDIKAHLSTPWHPSAGESLLRQQAQIDRLRDLMDRSESTTRTMLDAHQLWLEKMARRVNRLYDVSFVEEIDPADD